MFSFYNKIKLFNRFAFTIQAFPLRFIIELCGLVTGIKGILPHNFTAYRHESMIKTIRITPYISKSAGVLNRLRHIYLHRLVTGFYRRHILMPGIDY